MLQAHICFSQGMVLLVRESNGTEQFPICFLQESVRVWDTEPMLTLF